MLDLNPDKWLERMADKYEDEMTAEEREEVAADIAALHEMRREERGDRDVEVPRDER